MVLNKKPTLSLEQSDLDELITSQVTEGKTIDFKSELHVDTDDEKKEFLADISSFANASGGYLVYGMVEKQGIASELPGMSGLDLDSEKQRIENITRDGIDPRIIGITIQPIKLDNGNDAIVIHVPKSWASPHMVIYKGRSRFFTRNSAGKYQMDVQEIRYAFLMSENVSEKIRNFRLDRLSQISALETPVPLTEGAKVVLHIVPLTAFQSVAPINISGVGNDIFLLLPQAHNYQFNFDGLIVSIRDEQHKIDSYRQLFRNGSVEAVDNYLFRINPEGKEFPSEVLEGGIFEACRDTLRFQKKLGVETPVFIFLSLLHVKGYKMGVDPGIAFQFWSRQYGGEINRDVVILPEITIENYSSVDSLPDLLKPMFDACWNAFGWPRSMNYYDSGKWKLVKDRS